MLFSLLIAAAQPLPDVSEQRAVAGIMSSDDYPEEALRNDWQGDVVVDLVISVAGRVRSCRIHQSSGHQVLDLKTCEIFLLRARFTPAKDEQGNPVEDRFRAPAVRWRLGQ